MMITKKNIGSMSAIVGGMIAVALLGTIAQPPKGEVAKEVPGR